MGEDEKSPTRLTENMTEPHVRGAILVSAIFAAFLTIYKSRCADLIRLATNGSGVLPAGDISVDLANRLASEASKTAEHVLNMCIRALDYCPPIDLTFGEYLRALITADRDLVPDDQDGYRVAFIAAFRERGIYPCCVVARCSRERVGRILRRPFGDLPLPERITSGADVRICGSHKLRLA